MRNFETIIENIREETQKLGFDQISDKNVGTLLASLAASKPGATIVELGTGTGLGTAWLLKGMAPDSRLITVDNDSRLVEIAKRYLDFDHRVTFHVAMGEEIIDGIEPGSVDLIFADTWPGKYHYLDEALVLLKIGGIYVIDDMLPQANWPEGHEKKVEALIDYLHGRYDLQVCEMHWATGVVICTKTEGGSK